MLEKNPYRFFPVSENGRVKGMVARTEMETAIAEHRPLRLQPARECRPADSIRDSQSSLIDSATGTVLLTDHADGTLLAIVTLHDILRAQVSIGER